MNEPTIHRYLVVVDSNGHHNEPAKVDEYEPMESFAWIEGWDEPTEARAEGTSPMRDGSTWIWAWGTDDDKTRDALEARVKESVGHKMRYRIMSRLRGQADNLRAEAAKHPRGWARLHSEAQADAAYEEFAWLYREIYGTDPRD